MRIYAATLSERDAAARASERDEAMRKRARYSERRRGHAVPLFDVIYLLPSEAREKRPCRRMRLDAPGAHMRVPFDAMRLCAFFRFHFMLLLFFFDILLIFRQHIAFRFARNAFMLDAMRRECARCCVRRFYYLMSARMRRCASSSTRCAQAQSDATLIKERVRRARARPLFYASCVSARCDRRAHARMMSYVRCADVTHRLNVSPFFSFSMRCRVKMMPKDARVREVCAQRKRYAFFATPRVARAARGAPRRWRRARGSAQPAADAEQRTPIAVQRCAADVRVMCARSAAPAQCACRRRAAARVTRAAVAQEPIFYLLDLFCMCARAPEVRRVPAKIFTEAQRLRARAASRKFDERRFSLSFLLPFH